MNEPNDLDKLEERRKAVFDELLDYGYYAPIPFVKQDKKNIACLQRIKDRIDRELDVAANEFLKSNGFCVTGAKRKKRK
jgi:hypothetical protein